MRTLVLCAWLVACRTPDLPRTDAALVTPTAPSASSSAKPVREQCGKVLCPEGVRCCNPLQSICSNEPCIQ